MRITSQLTDDVVLAELGSRLARTRLERNLTQKEIGFEAGVGLATVRRLEDGQSVRLTSLVRVLRFLGLLDALDVLVPEPVPSPIERLRLRGNERQRARPRAGTRPEASTWKWGDESESEAT